MVESAEKTFSTVTKFTSAFFTVRQIARAVRRDKETVRRRARAERWPVRRRGNHFEYRAPKGTKRCNYELDQYASMAAILDKIETL